jgi:hypothetical protein
MESAIVSICCFYLRSHEIRGHEEYRPNRRISSVQDPLVSPLLKERQRSGTRRFVLQRRARGVGDLER